MIIHIERVTKATEVLEESQTPHKITPQVNQKATDPSEVSRDIKMNILIMGNSKIKDFIALYALAHFESKYAAHKKAAHCG